MSFTKKLALGFAGLTAVTATVWTWQQQEKVVEKQSNNILSRMSQNELREYNSRNSVDLKKMQQDRTEKLVGENRNLAWVMGQDTLKTYEDKIAKNIKKGTPISSANVWKQVGIKKTVDGSDKAVGITKLAAKSRANEVKDSGFPDAVGAPSNKEIKKTGWFW